MFFAEIGEDGIEIADEFDVDALLFVDGNGIPAGLGPVAVVIPLEKGNIVFREEFVEEAFDVVAHIGASEVEDELIAGFGARASGKIQDPFGMLAIEVGIGIDHFRFDPEAEVHAEGVDLVDERLEAVGEIFLS